VYVPHDIVVLLDDDGTLTALNGRGEKLWLVCRVFTRRDEKGLLQGFGCMLCVC
jgi:hypothetical protein